MKKKTFYQTSIFWQLICLFMTILFCLFLYVGIKISYGTILLIPQRTIKENIVSFVITGFILYFVFKMFKEIVRLEHNNIHLDENKIYMKDDWQKKNSKIQFYTEVEYKNIEKIDIFWSEKNSKGKNIKSNFPSSFAAKPYLSITTKSGKNENFFILYFSKKTLLKLIDELKRRMTLSGNNCVIEDTQSILEKLNNKLTIDE